MKVLLGLLPAFRAIDLGTGNLHREVAVIAYHFHWSRADCLSMSRKERRRWLDEIGRINGEIAKAMKPKRSRR